MTEDNRCKICGKPLVRGKICYECFDEYRQHKAKRVYLSEMRISPHDYQALRDLVSKYGIQTIMAYIGVIIEERVKYGNM